MRQDEAISKLYNMLHENVEKSLEQQADGLTVVGAWAEDVMSEYEEARKRTLPESFYRVLYGEDVEIDQEHHVYAYVPKRMVTFKISRLAAFISAYKLDNEAFVAVLAGTRLDEGGWRSMPFVGAANRPYTPPRELYKDELKNSSGPDWKRVYKADYKVAEPPINEVWEG